MSTWLNVHERRWRALPGLDRLELSVAADSLSLGGSAGDRRGPPFLTAEAYFADRGALDAAMVSQEGRDLLAALDDLAGEGFSLYVADVERDHRPR